LFFTADDPVHGREVWRSEGTPQGTVRITDHSSVAELDIGEPALVGSTLVFATG
jgi:ELWxxDGT repeat protein